MNKDIQKQLSKLFYSYFEEDPEQIIPLPHSGSDRSYYRLQSANNQAIGTHSPNKKENKTFLHMTRFFLQERIPVPEIYKTDLSRNIYLQEDLGDQTLFSILTEKIDYKSDLNYLKDLLSHVVKELVRIQITAGKKFDFSNCYPYREFNKSSVLFDLQYFRKQFLERIKISYNNSKLQKDFHSLTNFIDTADKDYFMYRDFQSRNIMVNGNKFYFIDYQGGRKGPLQYDLASLLFQARARIPENIKEEILDYYINLARMLTPLSKEEFVQHYYAIALIRVLQTLGAYGLKGLKERKSHFIQSIPFAIGNLNTLSEKNTILSDLPELSRIISLLINANNYNNGFSR